MMTKSVAQAYFEWLCSQVAVENRNREYTDLFALMHSMEFVWLVLGDDNRLQDGLALRREWREDWDPTAFCSVLEVTIALSRRMAFIVGGEPEGWAWQFMLNLGLERMYDPIGVHKAERIREILEALVYRTYSDDGSGGFFPLQDPDEDQRQIEIWYQMAAYIDEVLPD